MNSSWMQGYNSDSIYTTGYYAELEPACINISAIMYGIEPIQIEKSFTYCELGCGMGHTSLIMAANYPQGKFIAVDFNPTHISEARHLAETAGLKNIEFKELSFEEIVNDQNLLPDFDFIAFHGIYSWVSEENRNYLVDICKAHLKPGGLVYNSYNALPGWASSSPLQKLLNVLSQQFKGNTVERFRSATNFVDSFRQLKPLYFELNNKTLAPRLNQIHNDDPQYLIHEYMNDGWQAQYFSDVAENMSRAKLDFLGLANPAEIYAQTVIPDSLKKQLSTLSDPVTREMIKDYAYNTSFRKDIYSRGGRRIDSERQVVLLNDIRWMLVHPGEKSEFKFRLSVGEVTGKKEIYSAVLKTLSESPISTAELAKMLDIPISNLIQTLILLYSNNVIGIVNNLYNTAKLNKALIHDKPVKAITIAAGIIGTAVFVNPIEQVMLRKYLNSEFSENSDNSTIADIVSNQLVANDMRITIDGNAYTDESMKEHLLPIVEKWKNLTMPWMQRLGCF